MKIISIFKGLAGKLKEGLKRFPLPLLMATITAFIAIYLNHFSNRLSHVSEEQLGRVAMTFALGIPIFLCIQVFLEGLGSLKREKVLGIHGVGLLLMALYHVLWLQDFELETMVRYFGITVALYLLFTIIPHWKRKDGYVLYCLKLVTSFFTAFLYGIILFLGLSATIATVDALFSVNVSSKLYFDIFLLSAGIVAPAYFFSEIPPTGKILSLEEYPRTIRGLLSFIIMPLLSIYALILYLYFGKILMEGTWPIQLISHLVLWFAMISAGVIFFIEPLREKHSWMKGFSKWFPILMLPLLGMMFVAIGKRIGYYGITENRYYVLAAGVWVTLSMLYWIFRKGALPTFVIQLLTLFVVLSVAGPVKASTVARFSQNQRLETILNRNQMLKNQTVVHAPGEVSLEDQQEISQILNYFSRYHDFDDVRVLPKTFDFDDMETVFGFPYLYEIGWSKEYWNYILDYRITTFDISGYDVLINYSYYNTRDQLVTVDQQLSYQVDADILLLFLEGEEIYRKDLREVALDIHQQYQGKEVQLPQEALTYEEDTPSVKVKLLMKEFSFSEDLTDDTIQLQTLEFNLLIKVK